MKSTKIVVLLIVGIFIVSSTSGILGAIDDDDNVLNNDISAKKEFSMSLSKPIFIEEGDFIKVSLEEQTSFNLKYGRPMLPMVTKTFTFPLGTELNDISVQINQESYTLEKQITPSPKPQPLMEINKDDLNNNPSNNYMDDMPELYPENAYEIKTGAGLDGDEHVLIVNVRCYTQYKQSENKLIVPENIDIDIDYNPESQPIFDEDVYDMLIITHEKFETQMQDLVDHKNNMGIKTIMTTVDEIYDEYDGEDDWEDLKLYIADAIENWGITYLLLAGGHKGQTHEWYVPEFRSSNYDDNGMGDMDLTYSCDLYFADVFDANQYGKPVFDNWDTNENGVYAEGPFYNDFDIPDFYPDVYVGRLPIRFSWEADIVVDKIITYETSADDSWFKKAVFAAGDTSPRERYGDVAKLGIYEGELTCDNHAQYLENAGFETIKCYTSENGDIQVDDDEIVADVISDGCGWVNMQMHANPAVGGNHVMDTEAFIYFYTILDIIKFDNEEKLPFMVNDGCHNAQFDVTMQDIIDNGGINYPEAGWLEWVPHDGSSWFLVEGGGGAIGVIGNTALGYGYLNEGYETGLGGWIMPRFAHAYAVQGREYAGSIWGQGITDYINNFDINNDEVQRKTIEERALLGDPSLKLGGYGMALSDAEEEENEKTTSSFSVDAPVWQNGMSWTYDIDDLDIYFSETEGRTIELKLDTDDFTLDVTDVTQNEYVTEFETKNANIEIYLDFDYYIEGEDPIKTSIQLQNVNLAGQIVFDKDLAIKNFDIDINFDLTENIGGLPIEIQLTPLIETILSYISIPADITVQSEFDPAYPLFDFPFETGKTWGMPATDLTFRIDGEIDSIWLKVLNILNKFLNIIPPEFAKYLPVIDIGEMLQDLGIPSLINMELPEIEELLRKPIFESSEEAIVNTNAGAYNSYKLRVLQGVGELYYAPSVKNFVKLYTPLNEYIPVIQSIEMQLKSTNQ